MQQQGSRWPPQLLYPWFTERNGRPGVVLGTAQ